jgi:hypothetical protein
MKARIDERDGRKQAGYVSVVVSYYYEDNPDYIFNAHNFEFPDTMTGEQMQAEVIAYGQKIHGSQQVAETVKDIFPLNSVIDIDVAKE